MGLGANFTAKSRAQVRQELTPPGGGSQEAIWHQAFDTQTFTSASTTRLVFFAATNSDITLSNMEASGMFPAPQSFFIHNVCCDLWTAAPVSTSAGAVTGNVNDLFLLMLVGRPVWTLNISGKRYGPYSVSGLHGTGGPVGFEAATFTAPIDHQFAKNDPSEGWNYRGRVGIPEQVAFSMEVVWAAAQTLTANWSIRMSLFGVLNRRVL